MAWVGISGVVLLVIGLLAPWFGLILDNDFGRARFALCIIGMLLFGVAASFRRPRGGHTSSSGDDGFSDPGKHFGGHHGHDGDHGGDGGDGGH